MTTQNKNFNAKNGLSINGTEVIDSNANATFATITVDSVQLSGGGTLGGSDQFARDTANAAYGHANGAFSIANSAFNVACTVSISVNTLAHAAFDKANTAYDSIPSLDGYATESYVGDVYSRTNVAFDTANTAFACTGVALVTAAYAQDRSNAAFDKANTANNIAYSAYDLANTKLSSSGGTIAGNLSVTGNLVISGVTTTVNTNTVETGDSLIKLAANNTVSDILDIGFYGQSEIQDTISFSSADGTTPIVTIDGAQLTFHRDVSSNPTEFATWVRDVLDVNSEIELFDSNDNQTYALVLVGTTYTVDGGMTYNNYINFWINDPGHSLENITQVSQSSPAAIKYHGLIREGSNGTNSGSFYLFKNLTTEPTSNVVNYSSLTGADLYAGAVYDGGVRILDKANDAYDLANTSNTKAYSAYDLAIGAYNVACTATSFAYSAYDKANTPFNQSLNYTDNVAFQSISTMEIVLDTQPNWSGTRSYSPYGTPGISFYATNQSIYDFFNSLTAGDKFSLLSTDDTWYIFTFVTASPGMAGPFVQVEEVLETSISFVNGPGIRKIVITPLTGIDQVARDVANASFIKANSANTLANTANNTATDAKIMASQGIIYFGSTSTGGATPSGWPLFANIGMPQIASDVPNFTISQANNALQGSNFRASGNVYAQLSVGVGTLPSGIAGEIRAIDNITAYYSSDRKLKQNIQEIPNALNIVTSIGSKSFDWTDEYVAAHGGEDGYFVQKSDFGVIAQDVQDVFPQAVRTREDGTLAVDYEKLSTLAFGAIKELLKRIEVLEAK